MTVELYRFDPYQSRFDATVTDVCGDSLILEQTCFMPRIGGRACDLGVIGVHHVVGVERERSGTVIHRLEDSANHATARGDVVSCSLDWARRHRLMRVHSARHLVELGFRATHEAGPCLGGHVMPDVAKLHIALSDPADTTIELKGVERWISGIIAESLPIIHQPDLSLDRRWFWEIDGLGGMACAGTHVRSTSEIGEVRIGARQVEPGSVELSVALDDS